MASVLAEVRALCPYRPTAPWEARILAERQASKLLALSGVHELPVPEQLIETLPRVEVAYRRSESLSGTTRWRDGRWTIVLNANDTWGRQRFSLAHELKHVIDAPAERFLYRNRRYAPAILQRERAADYFAACLLMPKRVVKRLWCGGDQDLVTLAHRLQVSVPAVRYRLSQLGLTEGTARCDWRPTRLTTTPSYVRSSVAGVRP